MMYRFLLLLLLVVTRSSIFGQSLSDNLLIHYSFDGNALDQSGNNYHGVVNATLTEDRSGNANSAYHFDGVDDYIDLPNLPALKPQLPVTIAYWVKFEQPSLAVLATDFAQNIHTGVWFSVSQSGGNLAINYGDGTSTTSLGRRTKIGDTKIEIGTWYHVVGIVRGSDDIELYINCKNDAGQYSGTGGALAYSTDPVSLGRKDANPTMPPFYFNGSIDDFYYWDRALNENELNQLFQVDSPTVENQLNCKGESASLKAIGGSDGDFRWYVNEFDTSPIPGQFSDTYVTPPLESSTTYFVSLVQGVCESNKVAVTADIIDPPDANAGDDQTIQIGESIMLNATGGVTYKWSPVESLDNANLSNPIATPMITTTYTVTVSNVDGCKATDEITIIVNQGPTFDSDPVTIADISCDEALPLQETLTASSNCSTVSVVPSVDPYTVDICAGYAITYRWTATDNCGNSSETSVTFSLLPDTENPPFDRGPMAIEDISYDAALPVQQTLTASDNCSTISVVPSVDPYNVNLSTGYAITYRWTATDNCGNSSETSVTFNVLPDTENPVKPALSIPNAITPNGDQVNDLWLISNIDSYPDCTVRVFNRWGQEVYFSIGYKIPWNGFYNNKLLPADTYYYSILIEKEQEPLTGYLTILR